MPPSQKRGLRVRGPRATAAGRSASRPLSEPASQEGALVGTATQEDTAAPDSNPARPLPVEDQAPARTVYGRQDSDAFLQESHKSSSDIFGAILRAGRVTSKAVGGLVRSLDSRDSSGGDEAPGGAQSQAAGDGADAHHADGGSRAQSTATAPARPPSYCGCTCSDFPCCCSHCPLSFCALVLLVTPLYLAMNWQGIVMDADLGAFLKADTTANDYRVAFQAAKEERDLRRRLQSSYEQPYGTDFLNSNPPPTKWTSLHNILNLQVIYQARDGSNLLQSTKALSWIRDFERRLVLLPAWQDLCHNYGNPALTMTCEPGMSFPGLMWPTDMHPSEDRHARPYVQYALDSMGLEALPAEAMPPLVGDGLISRTFFPKGYEIGQPVDMLRTQFQFNLYCCESTDTAEYKSSQSGILGGKWEDFLKNDLLPAIEAHREEAAGEQLYIFVAGKDVITTEVFATLKSDVSYAIGSVMFILVYLSVHTRSPCVAIGSIGLILLAIPMAFVTSAAISGNTRVTGASLLALFLLVGLGADVVLVFTSFWGFSRVDPAQKTQALRVQSLWHKAGVACLSTSLTTAASFYANMASVLKALREFGFLMGTCIVFAYLYILVCIPGLLIMNDRLGACMSRYCCGLEVRHVLPTGLSWRRLHGEAAKPRDGRSGFQAAVDFYAGRVLVPFRHWVLFTSVALTITSSIALARSAAIAPDMPDMFPSDHNQNAGLKATEEFHQPETVWLKQETSFCNVGAAEPNSDGSIVVDGGRIKCYLNWCQTENTTPAIYGERRDDGSTECACVPGQGECVDDVLDGATMNVYTRFVGLERLPAGMWGSKNWEQHLLDALHAANPGLAFHSPTSSTSWTNLSTLVQEHWATGTVLVRPYILGPPSAGARLSSGGQGVRACHAAEICYCGAMICKFAGEPLTSPGVPQSQWLTLEITASGYSRLLAEEPPPGPVPALTTVPSMLGSGAPPRRLSTVGVSFVWGIDLTVGWTLLGNVPAEEMWAFSGAFFPDVPDTQRHLYEVCVASREDPGLLVTEAYCWIVYFRNWLLQRGHLFPTRASDFYPLLDDFITTTNLPNGVSPRNQMWFDSQGHMVATYYGLDTSASGYTTTATEAANFRDEWDRFVEEFTSEAPSSAGQFWHTSDLWIRLEAEQAILGSTINTLIVSLACGFVGAMASSSCDIVLSLMVVFTVAGVTIALAFFMACVMKWAFGAIEVLGLIVFVGYSITYSLHVSHKYREHIVATRGIGLSSATRRRIAVEHSLQLMTAAVVGSATTTLGASFFLFFCTLVIFLKLASVLFAVTFFSAVFAVVVLPSALAVCGPMGGCCWCNRFIDFLDSLNRLPEPDAEALGERVPSVPGQAEVPSGEPAPRPQGAPLYGAPGPHGLGSPAIQGLVGAQNVLGPQGLGSPEPGLRPLGAQMSPIPSGLPALHGLPAPHGSPALHGLTPGVRLGGATSPAPGGARPLQMGAATPHAATALAAASSRSTAGMHSPAQSLGAARQISPLVPGATPAASRTGSRSGGTVTSTRI